MTRPPIRVASKEKSYDDWFNKNKENFKKDYLVFKDVYDSYVKAVPKDRLLGANYFPKVFIYDLEQLLQCKIERDLKNNQRIYRVLKSTSKARKQKVKAKK